MSIDIRQITKSYGAIDAVAGIDLHAADGRVTGFLGANGAGKSTTLRILMGLIPPDRGEALIDGSTITDLARPSERIGAALRPDAHHPDRSGRDHLRVLASGGSIDPARVDSVLAMTDLTTAADRRAGSYSTGMKQRLHLAAALLADPQHLVLDEPTNGLDPQGIRWLREFLRGLAGAGRCVLLSSHVLGEVAQTVDDVVVIRSGRVVVSGTLDDVFGTDTTTSVRTTQRARLSAALDDLGAHVVHDPDDDELAIVDGVDAATIGQTALTLGVLVTELAPRSGDLEQRFIELTTADRLDNRSHP
ncbi:MAG: ATP-binding cassette domain-containing protein [Ilumatobacter sp.]